MPFLLSTAEAVLRREEGCQFGVQYIFLLSTAEAVLRLITPDVIFPESYAISIVYR